MKITIVSYEDPTKSSTWSGTTFNMYKALKNNERVTCLDSLMLSTSYTKIVKKFTYYLYKYILRHKIANFETTKIGKKYWGRRLDKVISNQKVKSDYYFLPAGAAAIAGSKIKEKLIYLPDATYKLMNKYYYNSNLSIGIVGDGNDIDLEAMDKSDKIITPSKWCYQSVLDDYKQPKRKIELIEFGANLPNIKKIKREDIFEKKVIKLLLVGVDYKRKGISLAIKTINYLNNIDIKHQYTLTIVGLDKPEGLTNEKVFFKGKLNKDNPSELVKLENEYIKADFFILPTQAEAAGIAFAEAQMFGLPIITYLTGGIGNYVTDRISGYTLDKTCNYKEFAKKILNIVGTPGLYVQFSNNAREHYEKKLNWKRWSDKVMSAIIK